MVGSKRLVQKEEEKKTRIVAGAEGGAGMLHTIIKTLPWRVPFK